MYLTITGKSVDEEEYLLIRMHREKMVGENLQEGSREVAFELWIQRIDSYLSSPQRKFPPLSGKQYRNYIFPY